MMATNNSILENVLFYESKIVDSVGPINRNENHSETIAGTNKYTFLNRLQKDVL